MATATTRIRTQADLEMAVKLYNMAAAELNKKQAAHEERIAKLKKNFTEDITAQAAELAELNHQITVFVRSNEKKLFNGTAKTLKFGHGVVSIRRTESLDCKDWQLAAAQIQDAGLDSLLSYSVKVKKASLKDLSDLDLAEYGVTRTETVHVNIKPAA